MGWKCYKIYVCCISILTKFGRWFNIWIDRVMEKTLWEKGSEEQNPLLDKNVNIIRNHTKQQRFETKNNWFHLRMC